MTSKYITDFRCTYKKFEDNDDSLILYRYQLLQAFGIDKYNDEIINSEIENLYNKFKNNINIQKIIEKNKIYLEDDLINFMLLFQYDIFYLFHDLLCILIDNEKNEKNENRNIDNITNEIIISLNKE